MPCSYSLSNSNNSLKETLDFRGGKHGCTDLNSLLGVVRCDLLHCPSSGVVRYIHYYITAVKACYDHLAVQPGLLDWAQLFFQDSKLYYHMHREQVDM